MDIELRSDTVKALHSEYGRLALHRGSMEDLVNEMVLLWIGQQRTARRIIEEHTPVPAFVAETS